MTSKEKKSEIKALKQKAAEAEALADMKSNFLATMSHEIRTPMQTIYGLLELIADEKPDRNVADMVSTAQGAASGLLEILDDVLDLAKMDAEKMELDVYEVPVRTLVRGILEALAVKVQNPNVKLLAEIDEGVPFVIIGDPKRLRQIIMNLIGNALKFTQKGSIVVNVTEARVIKVPKGKIGLRFEVSDTGIGMSKEVCDRLFESFSQADSSTSRKFGGTGLGLSISKKLVTLMDGDIGVTSKEGKGSTFWFEIPTEAVDTDQTTIKLPSLDGISVLSVEDHPQGAKEIANSLRSMGAKVESCPTYKEGLELAKRIPFDVGVIDQGLPDGLGLNLIKDIMKIRPHMGMIMYTVRDDVGLQHSLMALGCKYLTKPASRAGLGETVKDAAGKAARISITGPTRLLIAEDTDSVRDILRRQLEKLGVDADFVTNGAEALKALKTGKYGILFTDLHMPEIDGYALTETIRQNEEGTEDHFPIIVLTADVQMSQRETYLRHGFDECLLKPVTMGQFRQLLIRWGLLIAPDVITEDTTKPKETSAGTIDKDAIIAQMGALDEGTIEMLNMFVEMTVPLVDRIKKADKKDDHHDLMEAGHSLKGAARSACCPALGDLAAQLQKDAEKKENCSALVADIVAEFKQVKKEIKKIKPDSA